MCSKWTKIKKWLLDFKGSHFVLIFRPLFFIQDFSAWVQLNSHKSSIAYLKKTDTFKDLSHVWKGKKTRQLQRGRVLSLTGRGISTLCDIIKGLFPELCVVAHTFWELEQAKHWLETHYIVRKDCYSELCITWDLFSTLCFRVSFVWQGPLISHCAFLPCVCSSCTSILIHEMLWRCLLLCLVNQKSIVRPWASCLDPLILSRDTLRRFYL